MVGKKVKILVDETADSLESERVASLVGAKVCELVEELACETGHALVVLKV
jgi:hypothetical protein